MHQAAAQGHVGVVGGGSLPKLGMKFQGHLRHGMPILEDIIGGVAVLVTADDGDSPVRRSSSTAKQTLSCC